MSYACTVEPLRAANLLSKKRLYDVVHFDDGTSAQSSGAANISADARVGQVLELDLFLVIAGGDPSAFDGRAVFPWLARMARTGAQIGGVSGGPYILAKAGLMDGRRMTVHWEHAPALSELEPGLLVKKLLFVIDRDRVTCGGGTSPLDMMHALIAQHHGADLARLVGDWFLHTGIRDPAEPQRGGLVERIGTSSSPVLHAVAAMESHIADPLSLDQLATVAGVTIRQLNRLFRDKLGVSTMAYYRKLRLRTGRRLSETSPISLTEIALATGFANSSHYSKSFSAEFGAPPSSLRS